MKTMNNVLRRAAIFILGMLIVIIGVILIPLPGPGLLVVLLGLILLAKEFTWAERHVATVKGYLAKIANKAKSVTAKPTK